MSCYITLQHHHFGVDVILSMRTFKILNEDEASCYANDVQERKRERETD